MQFIYISMNAKAVKQLLKVSALTACAVMFVSCGARKNTAVSRFYHSLNSKYNIYYNGKTNFDEALRAMNDGYRENYTEQIVLFPVSGIYRQAKTTTGGAFNLSIEKGNKAIKLHSIKDKPPRKSGWQNDPRQVKLQQQEEFNPFMKHCWLMIAQSHYYNGDFLEAAVTFSYISRHFSTDNDLVAEARIWQARCYTEMDWLYETNNILKKLAETGIPLSQQKNYDRMYADYLIRNERQTEAIPYLQNTVKAEKNKRQRSRQRYLLGQLYQNTGKNDSAYMVYRKVASSNPPYEIEFAARIRQTEVVPEANTQQVLKMLNRMAKSDKNKDYLDQVYYALGNVYMTKQDTAKAIACYAEGIEKSTKNGMDKAICQIRLGDIYFEQKEYLKAQPCYSGALAAIQKEYKDYERIARLSETLDELVIHYEAVQLQDSLQELARMPEKERLEVIDKIIAQLIEDEKKAKEEAEKEAYLSNQASMGSNLNRPGSNINTSMISTAGADGFYFYNSQVVAQGKLQFQNRWGKRTLEDNWRRRDKKMALLASEEDMNGQMEGSDNQPEISDAVSDSLMAVQAVQDSLANDPKSREYYLQQIPLTEEDLEASNKIIEDGLYNMGMVYKDKLENMDLSVETFEELERRFPENTYRLDYYYQIYLMALRYKNEPVAEKYKSLLLAQFPESDYAIAISDPDYEYNMRMMDKVPDSIYEYTYERYLVEDIEVVRNNYMEVSSKYPLAKLMPKFMFLNALTYVQEGDPEGFKQALTTLTEKYPDADVTELANEMLKGLLRGRTLMQNSFSTLAWDMRFGVGEEGILSAADSARTFSAEQNTPHRMLLIYNTGTIDRNQLLYAVAAYNFANFRVKGFDINYEEIGSITIMTVSSFGNLNEIIEYYRMINRGNGYAPALEGTVSFFPISDVNYDILMHGKTLDEYMTFFVENFGELAPELVNRWRIRVDADRREEEEERRLRAEEEEKRLAAEQAAVESETSIIQQIDKSFVDEPLVIDTVPELIIPEPDTIQIPVIKADTISLIDEEDERPKAKGENIFRRLFKRLRETKEYKSIEEGINTIRELAEEETALPADSVEEKKTSLERVDGELTLEQIQELRKRENEAKAAQEAETALTKAEDAQAAKELKKQQAAEREKLKKQKEKEAKQRLREREKERKLKEKERKQKEREKRAQQAKERKAKQQAKKK